MKTQVLTGPLLQANEDLATTLQAHIYENELGADSVIRILEAFNYNVVRAVADHAGPEYEELLPPHIYGIWSTGLINAGHDYIEKSDPVQRGATYLASCFQAATKAEKLTTLRSVDMLQRFVFATLCEAIEPAKQIAVLESMAANIRAAFEGKNSLGKTLN